MSLTFEDLPDDVHQRILDTISCPKCLNNLASASPSCLHVLQVHRRSTLWRLALRTIPVLIADKLRPVCHLDVEPVLVERLLRTCQKSLLESVRQLRFLRPELPHLEYLKTAPNYPRRDLLGGHYCNTGCSASCFDGSAPCVTQTVLEIILPELWVRNELVDVNRRFSWHTMRRCGPGLIWARDMPWNAIELAMFQMSGEKLIYSKPQMHHINCPVHLSVKISSSYLIFRIHLPRGTAEAVKQYIKEHWGLWDESFLSQNGEPRSQGLETRFYWKFRHGD
ncbi:hypothetical protein QBC36DRAFT_36220 [Triangularia setosa]|uniref:F-box domain-containing protein n=1 Tax=Triangularia setosa TaxID=2587417 RepID=A0AAN6W3W9_9PEZI|nr:hypothetical protein QBC36DRAFT_36220 [Podospora setosa]